MRCKNTARLPARKNSFKPTPVLDINNVTLYQLFLSYYSKTWLIQNMRDKKSILNYEQPCTSNKKKQLTIY
jgi:hypothetical protein